MAGTQAVPEAKRGTFFWARPENLTIVGLDCEAEGDLADLADYRSHLPVDDERARAMAAGAPVPALWVMKDGANRVVVIDGRQRTRHARRANEFLAEAGQEPIEIPIIVKKFGSMTEYVAAMVAANASTPEAPMGLARKLVRLRERGKTEAEIARLVNRTGQYVRDAIALLDCSEAVQKAVDKAFYEQGEGISAMVARELARLPRAEQDAKLAELQANGLKGRTAVSKIRKDRGLSVRMMPRTQIESWAKQVREDKEADKEDRKIVLSTLAAIAGEAEAMAKLPASLRYVDGRKRNGKKTTESEA